MAFPFRNAPLPLVAQKRSPKTGFSTTPNRVSPSAAKAMDVQKHGRLWAKLVVPSNGSIIQRHEELPATCPVSSAKME